MARYPAALAASSSSSPARPSSSSSPTKTRASSRRRRNDDLLAHFPFRSRRNKRLANDAAALLAAKRQSARLSRANLNAAIASSDQQQQKTLPPIPPLGRRRNFFKAMQRKRSQPTSGGASPPQSSSASTSPSSPSSSTSSNSLASSSSITSTDATSLATSASASSSCPLSDRARGVVEAVRVAAPSSATSKLKELSDSKSRTTDHASQPSQDGSAAGDDSEDSLQRRNRREAAAQNLQRWPWAGDDTFGAEASNPLHKLDPSSPARPSSPEPYGALIAPLVTPPPRQQQEQPPSPVTVYEIASTPPIPQGGLFAPAHDGANHSHWSVSTLGPANRSVLLPSPRIDRPLWLPPPPPGDALKPRRKAVPQAQPPPPPPPSSQSQPKQKMQRQRYPQQQQQQQQRSSSSTHVTGLGYLGAGLGAHQGVGSSSIVEEGSCINFEWTSVTDRDEVTMSSSIDDDCDAQSEGGDGLGLDPAIFDSTGTEYGDVVVAQPRGAPWHAAQHGQEQRGHWRSRSSIDCDGFGGHHLRTSDLDILSKFEMVSTAEPVRSRQQQQHQQQQQPAFAAPPYPQQIDRTPPAEPIAFEPQIQVSFEAVPPPQCAETMAPSSAIAWTVTVTHNGEEKVVRGQASLESLLPLLPAQPAPSQAPYQENQHYQAATPVLLLSPVMEDASTCGAFSRERTLSNVSSTSASSAFTSRGQRVRYNSESTDATGTSAATTASSGGPRFKPRPFMLSGTGAGAAGSHAGEERCSRLLGEELHERAQRKASLIAARRASSRLTVANITPTTSAAPSPSPTSSTLSIPDRSASLAHQQRTSTAATIRASTLLLRSQYASLASSTTPMPRYYGKRPSFAPPVVLGSSSYARERARPYPTAAGCQKLQQPFLLSASAGGNKGSRTSVAASWRASTYRVAGEGVERRVCYDVRRHRLEHAATSSLRGARYVPTSSAVCI